MFMVEQKGTKLEKALDFKAKYESLINEAKDEALAVIQEQLAELKKLGFEYQVVEASARVAKPAASSDKKRRVCKICGQPGHNARTCPQKKD